MNYQTRQSENRSNTFSNSAAVLPQFQSAADMIADCKPTEPVYCLYPHMLQSTVAMYINHFPGHAMYAVKANPDPHVIQHLSYAGLKHFDTASLQEIKLVKGLCPDAVCYFMAPVKFPGAAREAYHQYGVRHFVVDDRTALESLVEEIGPEDSIIFARMAAHNTDAVVNLSSKYGASLEDTIALLQCIDTLGATPALAFNVGSLVRKPDAYQRAMQDCRRVLSALSFPVRWLDVGGGFPVSYPGLENPDLRTYFQVIADVKDRVGLAPGAQLLAEPGRSMVAHSMSTVTQVLLRKGNRLYLNDGTYGSFSELLSCEGLSFPTRCYRDEAGGLFEKATESFELFGPTCCSLDKLPHTFSLPRDISRGDWIEFGLMGAYSLSNRTAFNGIYPHHMVDISDKTSMPPA